MLQKFCEALGRLDGLAQGLTALRVAGRPPGQVVLVTPKTIRHAVRVRSCLADEFRTVGFAAHGARPAYDRDAIADEIGRSTRGMMYDEQSCSAFSHIWPKICSIGSLGRSPQYRRTIR